MRESVGFEACGNKLLLNVGVDIHLIIKGLESVGIE